MTQPGTQNPTVVDTSAQVETAPVVTDGNAEIQSNEVATPGADVEAQKTELAQKREEGKLRQVQAQLKEKEEVLNKIANWASKDEKRFREALKEVQGYTDDRVELEVAELKKQGYWQEQNQVQPNFVQDPYYLEMKNFIDSKRLEEALSFEKGKPELEGKPLDDPQASAFRLKLDTLAGSLAKIPEYSGKSGRELLELSYQMAKASEIQSQVAKEAELSGMMKANLDNATSMSTPSASRPDNKSSVQLTDVQQRYADAAGMTPEEYLKWSK